MLALDAFARCWVQEGTLLDAVSAVLPDEQRAAMERLQAAWWARGQATWQASVAVLAERLCRAAQDREQVPSSGWMGKLKEVGAALGLRREGTRTPREQAMSALAERLDIDIRTSTERLIRLHGLTGEATGQVLTSLAEHFSVQRPLSEGQAAVWGGVVTGALAGLKADIASAGLTMGGGLLAGGVLGALGAAGLARGYNTLRGVEVPTLAWADPVLDELARSALLGYLAVAHYGRGRGDWHAWEHPEFWQDSVNDVVAQGAEALHDIWDERQSLAPDELAARLQDWLSYASEAVLARLYPGHGALLSASAADDRRLRLDQFVSVLKACRARRRAAELSYRTGGEASSSDSQLLEFGCVCVQEIGVSDRAVALEALDAVASAKTHAQDVDHFGNTSRCLPVARCAWNSSADCLNVPANLSTCSRSPTSLFSLRSQMASAFRMTKDGSRRSERSRSTCPCLRIRRR